MPRDAVTSDKLSAPGLPFSMAVRGGGLLFFSGQVATDPATGELINGDVAQQTEQVLRNLAAVLDAAGCTFADVVKTTCFLADINDFATFNEVYGRFMTDPPPARSTFQVAALPMGARVEIEAIAIRNRT